MVVTQGTSGIGASAAGSGWGCPAGAGRRAPPPQPQLRASGWVGVYIGGGGGGRLPGAGPYQVGVGALQGHGTRITAQDAHHPTGQLLDALQNGGHLALSRRSAHSLRCDPSAEQVTRAWGGASSHLTAHGWGGAEMDFYMGAGLEVT